VFAIEYSTKERPQEGGNGGEWSFHADCWLKENSGGSGWGEVRRDGEGIGGLWERLLGRLASSRRGRNIRPHVCNGIRIIKEGSSRQGPEEVV